MFMNQGVSHMWRQPFNPVSFGKMLLWLKADTGTFQFDQVTPAGTNEPVGKWNDQSGSGNHMTQTVKEAFCPTRLDDALNSYPGVYFYWKNTQWLTKAFSNTNPTVTMMVFKIVSEQTDQVFFDGGNHGDGTFAYMMFCNDSGAGSDQYFIFDGGFSSDFTLAIDTPYVARFQFQNSNGEVDINGTALLTGQPLGGAAPGGFTLGNVGDPSGGAFFSDMIVYEVMQWVNVLTAAQILDATNYLKAKYAIS